MRASAVGRRLAEHGVVAVGRAILPAVGGTHDALSLDNARELADSRHRMAVMCIKER